MSSRPALTLVLGGARSGKSAYAQKLAAVSGKVLFVATATAGDEEMRQKIDRHRQDRDSEGLQWSVLEEPLDLASAFNTMGYELIFIDCLTLFAGNVLQLNAAEWPGFIEAFLQALAGRNCPVILVSNEVGSGIVPEYAMGRQYRELLGELNQRVAELATNVVLMVAGLPLVLKSGGGA